jgi:hypothetical protein
MPAKRDSVDTCSLHRTKVGSATVLGRVKRWRLAMLALRAARGSGAAARF